MVAILIIAMSAVSVSAASLDRFTDAGSHWAAEVLEKAVNDGVLNGSGDKLTPNGTLTGAQMAAILVRKTDAQQWSQAYPGTELTDWYYMTCAVAMHEGILPEDGSISPDASVTRMQVFRAFINAFDFNTDEPDMTQLERYTDVEQLSDEDAAAVAVLTAAGIVSGNDKGLLQPDKNITRAEFVTMLYRAEDRIREGLQITLNADNVSPGAQLKASAGFTGISDPVVCEVQWYLDGEAVSDYYAPSKTVDAETASSFTRSLQFTRNMALSHRVGLGLSYVDRATGETVRLYKEKTVSVENYNNAHYNRIEYKDLYDEALKTVSPVYRGNYKSSYNIDYSADIKKGFVNAKNYSSKTNYLVWVNLATQKVNVFTGSQGDWNFIQTFRCASGAKSTPTPTGVTYVTYKQTAWVTSSYKCRPIVRFYPGTGYAFHSMLYYPNSNKLKDGSMGYPVSHGCIRMEDVGIYWIYNNIPVNTTVVIY